jgi:fatty-acyl-CoA synthase
MATLQLREGLTFDPLDFSDWVDNQADLGPKWRPRYVRITEAIPTTPSNKTLKRVLVHQKYRHDRAGSDPMWWRARGEAAFHLFSDADEKLLHDGLVAAGRDRFWDL